MSPEQVKGEHVGPATDLCSLGVLLYELVTGRTSFTSNTPFEMMNKQVQQQPPSPRQFRPDLPDPAQAAILRVLAKAPTDRFQSAGELAQAFAMGLQGQWVAGLAPKTVPTPAATAVGQGATTTVGPYVLTPTVAISPPLVSRRRLLATTGARVAVLATAGGATWLILSQSAHTGSSYTPTATPLHILTTTPSQGPGTLRWLFPTGDEVNSSPTVANGVVYVGSDDHNLYAVDASTDIERWRFPTRGFVRSTSTVANGVVYVGSFDYNLYAVDA